jgi:hypothetical protein
VLTFRGGELFLDVDVSHFDKATQDTGDQPPLAT